ncbi:hypothetical protein ABAC460_11955 [Asticcacaulis sp. AC460]|nr:hypothetical protein ABAC460_11955 [Asticcacaulis sp. AC460]
MKCRDMVNPVNSAPNLPPVHGLFKAKSATVACRAFLSVIDTNTDF